jgi:UDP-hydrolysing UDP-N-acetyl-D-glucosamine 2-epimerase
MSKPVARRICVVTGGRADYGALAPVMRAIQASPSLDLLTVAAGMHLSAVYGNTVDEIVADCFTVDGRGLDVAFAVSDGVAGFARTFAELAPDAVLVLGDRFEIFAAVTAATLLKLPVIHLCGGDVSEGAVDDVLRHAMTKMAHLHFATNEHSAARIRQMGEAPANVHVVGSPGIDAIVQFDFLDRGEIESRLGFKLRRKNLLITFHPVTMADDLGTGELAALLEALASLGSDIGQIFTMPNADAGGRGIAAMIENFVAGADNRIARKSLGQALYLSLLREADAVVGNSSSGLSEAPSLNTPTLDIGARQKGRLSGSSVAHCPGDAQAIRTGIDTLFGKQVSDFTNPYGDGQSAVRIISVLERTVDFRALLNKIFHRQDAA